jgi:hypothetical protein
LNRLVAATEPGSTDQKALIFQTLDEKCPLNWDDGSSHAPTGPVRGGTSQMRLLHSLARTSAVFGDPNLLPSVGLVPLPALADAVKALE